MMKQNNSQPSEPIQNPKNILVIAIVVVITALIVGSSVFMWQQLNLNSVENKLQQQITVLQNQVEDLDAENLNQNLEGDNRTIAPADPTVNWQSYSNSYFSYKCPPDQPISQGKNYNGQVDVSVCSVVGFSFVPKSVSDSYKVEGEKWSDILLNEVRNESNAQVYSNNGFIGWVSMKNQKHTMTLIARYQVEGGYYEVLVDVIGDVDTRTDYEIKQMADGIIATFKIK
ncbi:MAG: hypothetical protein Q7K65_03300 [Candidatus Buchananbacteria bacterium]|nr:hypothetical protein [Candidatus Buchananbacteria bacterium]